MDTRSDAIARLEIDIEEGSPGDVGQFLLEFLAEWGSDHVDVQQLAERVLARQGG